MNIKRKVLKFSFLLLLAVISIVVTFLTNQFYISILVNNSKVISASNVSSVKTDDVIEVTGTINYLSLVFDKDQNVYYAGLKEFDNKIIVKFTPDRLSYNPTKFIGRVINVSELNSYQNLITKLNSPINVDDLIKQGFLKPTDTNIIQQVNTISTSDFNNNSMVLMDGNYINKQLLIVNIVVFPIILFGLLVILFRRLVYY